MPKHRVYLRRFVSDRAEQFVVAIVGGATAGAEAAGMLAARGITAVVFEQNPRPYGKIEDGLPRWHVKLRRKEFETINTRLARPGVHFVPNTKVGRDLDFDELVQDWGFSAVILAHGAWHDRPLPIEGAAEYVGKGLVYQNSLIYWFNHFTERGYEGPHHEVVDGAIVVGGGLASIDVMKVLQLEGARQALAERGIDEEMAKLERDGIPDVLAEHGLTWDELGLHGATLFYRRRIEDMPLTDIPEDADPAKVQKLAGVRRRILEKAMQKYCFTVCPLRMPVGLLVERGRLAGLRFQRTRVEDGKVAPVDGKFEDVRAPLVVSSIGSVPEPTPGIPMRGHLYRWTDDRLGRLEGYPTVFSVGNVVTGKGNILESRQHSVSVSAHVIEQFLGLGSGTHRGEEAMLQSDMSDADEAAASIADAVVGGTALTPAQADALLARVRARQETVGYTGTYEEWLERVTPSDLV
jgi:NADPH-dependent glutamate synthase beta subunit-like oxidoreductase